MSELSRRSRPGLAFVYLLLATIGAAGACSTSNRQFAKGGVGGNSGESGQQSTGGSSGKAQGGVGAVGSGGRPGSSNAAGEAGSNVDGGDAGSSAVGGASPAGGSSAAGGTTSRPDGGSCTANQECASQHCIDGVCCESTCEGCKACSRALTNQEDGKCAPVVSGQDPHAACADETATNQCGKDGECDGSGACRKVSSSHVCSQGSCSADGKTFTPTSTCSASGSGACSVSTAQDCGGYPCTSTGCAKPCTAQADCGTNGNYCDTSTGKCAAQKPDGTAATNTFECRSGVVADGYCCNVQCTGNCQSCKQTPGTCKSVTTPRTACNGSGTCGTMKCDGTHTDCVYPASDVACPKSCSTDWTGVMSSTCNGSGACGTATKSGCNSDQYCNTATSTCASKLATTGSPACSKDIQCQSNTCCGGHCVNKSTDSANCGGCGNACASNQGCSNGTCACNASACGGSDLCGAWSFESCALDAATWTLDTNADQSGAFALAVSASNPKSGTCALKFNMTSSGNYAFLRLHLCNDNGKTTVVKGIQMYMKLVGTTLTNVVSKGGVYSSNNGVEVGGANFQAFPFTTDVYQLVSLTFAKEGPATDIFINFLAPGYNWDGTVYIDDVKIF